MDQIKIGKFIAEMRKEQNLTQIDLADQLGISNKTISKWECGNGMPDYAVMETLCDVLKINVNELLSGERLPSKEYNKKAEENIMSLMQESSENYKREKKEMLLIVVGIVAFLCLVMLIIIMWGGIAAIGNFIDVPTFTYVTAILILVLAIAGMLKDFIKAFPTALKRDIPIEKYRIRRSIIAIKTAMIGANVAGALTFFIGIVISVETWGRMENPLNQIESITIWIAVALLSIVYALVITLILIPIYMRLKTKLIEE